jgi:hypothetical protein
VEYSQILTARFILLLIFLPLSGLASAAPEKDKSIKSEGYVLNAQKIPAAPVIDGYLEPEIWKTVPAATNFIQRQPDEGRPATEETEVRVIYDDENIYVGAMCYDSEPDKIIANEKRRDSDKLTQNDHFEVMLDTFHDRRNGYLFIINPLGAKLDLQIRKEGKIEGRSRQNNPNSNRDWNAVWEVKTAILDNGWSAEIKIPLYNLRYNGNQEGVWGINFLRNVRRKNEASTWFPLPRNFKLTKVSMAGELRGLGKLSKGLHFQAKPYILANCISQQNAEGNLAHDPNLDAGIDLKYGLTSSLTVELTGNTDFSQVEADDQQINLTRFDLYFPEKREFFLENAALFSVGSPEDAMLFFSRRIGISDAGEVIPLLGGAKIAGKLGKFNVGMLNLQAQSRGMIPSNNFSVVRASRDVLKKSAVGLLLTNRQSAIAGDYNRAFALDGDFLFGDNLSISSYYAQTFTPYLKGKRAAGKLSAKWVSDFWEIRGHYLDIQGNFNAEMGFVKRTDIRTGEFYIGYTPEPDVPMVRQLNPHIMVSHTTNHAGQRLEGQFHADMVINYISGGRTGLQWNNNFDLVDIPFDIQENITIPVGAYSIRYWELNHKTDESRNIYGEAKLRNGTFYGGDSLIVNGKLGLRPVHNFWLEGNLVYNDIDLPQGDFINHLLQGRMIYSYSKKLSLMGLVQWNSETHEVNTNYRMHFIYRPGSDLFLVYNERRMIEGVPIGILDRTIALKFNCLFNF